MWEFVYRHNWCANAFPNIIKYQMLPTHAKRALYKTQSPKPGNTENNQPPWTCNVFCYYLWSHCNRAICLCYHFVCDVFMQFWPVFSTAIGAGGETGCVENVWIEKVVFQHCVDLWAQIIPILYKGVYSFQRFFP